MAPSEVLASAPVLPISAVTPGAINANVTQGNIQSTICTSGFTATIRPFSSFTTNLKKQQLDGDYAFYHDTNTSDFEEDHLISLEIGGSATSALNLWPEPYAGATGARIKDVVENKLHELVCNGTIALNTAQQAISSNWFLAYEKYVQKINVSIPLTAGSTAASNAASFTGSKVPSSASAKCRDGTLSYSKSRSGTCSKHGGVATWAASPGATISTTHTPTPASTIALGSVSSPQPSASTAHIFSMPFLVASNINQLVSSWSAYGFLNPPVIIVGTPFVAGDSCAPWQGSSGLASLVFSTDPKYLSLVTPQTQVTITLFCQEIFNSSNPISNANPNATQNPTPTVSPIYAPSPSASVDTGTSTSLGPKTCYVNGYVTKKGKVVSGYWRRC